MDLTLKGHAAALFMRHRSNLFKLAHVMGAAMVSRAAQLGVVLVVARQLGPTDFGAFVFAIGASIVAGVLGSLGWPLSFNRFFALLIREQKLAELHGLIRASTLLVLTGSLATAGAMLIASFFTEELAFGLIAGAFLTIPYGLMTLRRQQLAGTGQAPLALLLDQGLSSMALFCAALLFRLTLFEMLCIYAVTMVIGNLAATIIIRRRLPPTLFAETPVYELGVWMRSGISLLVGRSARLLLTRLDVLLIPALANLTEAGLYGAALRATYILTFPQFVLQTLTGPQLADAFARKQRGRARKILAASVFFALATTLPFVAVIVFAPIRVMTLLFGPSFADGANALLLITLGQLAIGLGMPFANVLAMGAREYAFGILNVGVLIVSVILAAATVPAMGAAGGGLVMLISAVLLLLGQIGLSLAPLGIKKLGLESGKKAKTEASIPPGSEQQ